MAGEDISIKVRLAEARKAAADADRVGRSMKGMGRDARGAGRESQGAARGFGSLNSRMRVTKGVSVGAGAGLRGLGIAAAGLGVAGIGAARGLKFAVGAAVAQGEQVNKTGVVFRRGAADVLKFADTSAVGLGISKRAALEAAGTFGNMLVPMGVARDRAGDMSTRMVELAADMASFNNASPEETLQALQSGLAGETEPLRRLGVSLTAVRVEQEALDRGFASSKDNITAAAKAQATYSLILKDTNDQQGDFARTSGGLANRQRQLKAQWEDLGAVLGRSTVPELERAAGAASDFLASTERIARSDRSTEGKARAIGEAARREFQPLARELAGALKEAEIGDHIADSIEKAAPEIMEAMGHGAVRAADGFARAFIDSGPYGKMFAVALVASKLGAFGAAGRAAGGLFARSTATTVATQLPESLNARQGRMRGGMRPLARGLGRGFGVTMGAAAAIYMVDRIQQTARERIPAALDSFEKNNDGRRDGKGIGEALRDLPGQSIDAGADVAKDLLGIDSKPKPRPRRRRLPGEVTGGGPGGTGRVTSSAFRARPDSGRRMKVDVDVPIPVTLDGRPLTKAVAKVRVRSMERGG